ncbi:hypothetical protein GWK47_036393 [Chionoecetes opilio]|uniref:Uncharacterized protein n=1 Tax=Chionoecetes opilio TaxID=41210 RepID=A0A8J5D2Q1_CHIOP|nr:hypothetical protein GWK47_036393 [Chionoecetes opilio]
MVPLRHRHTHAGLARALLLLHQHSSLNYNSHQHSSLNYNSHQHSSLNYNSHQHSPSIQPVTALFFLNYNSHQTFLNYNSHQHSSLNYQFTSISSQLQQINHTSLPSIQNGCLDPPGNGDLADLVANAIESARPLISSGIPDLGIPPLDPLGPVPPVSFHLDTLGLRMDGTVDETLIANLATFIVCSLNISIGLSQKFAIEFRLDNFHMDGLYDVDGLIAGLFPVFGGGKFRLDTYDTGFYGSAKLAYSVFTDHASIKNLDFNVFFKNLEVSKLRPAIFDAVWGAIKPPLADLIQTGINQILKNISISDIITPDQLHPLDLGNANVFVDLIMGSVNDAIVSAGLDPAQLQDAAFNLGLGKAELYDGEVVGLSTLYRSGLCTLDKVASWVFLYANFAVEDMKLHYKANVTSGATTSLVTVEGTVQKVAIYVVARKDTFGDVTDIDQFVITKFGNIDIDIDGLGVLGILLEPLTEVVLRLVQEDIADMLETDIKDLLQDVLGETPWPAF